MAIITIGIDLAKNVLAVQQGEFCDAGLKANIQTVVTKKKL